MYTYMAACQKNLKDSDWFVTPPRHTPASYPLSCFLSHLLSHPFVRCFVTPVCHPLRHTFGIPPRHTLLSFLRHVYGIPFRSLSSGFAGHVLLLLLCVARSSPLSRQFAFRVRIRFKRKGNASQGSPSRYRILLRCHRVSTSWLPTVRLRLIGMHDDKEVLAMTRQHVQISVLRMAPEKTSPLQKCPCVIGAS